MTQTRRMSGLTKKEKSNTQRVVWTVDDAKLSAFGNRLLGIAATLKAKQPLDIRDKKIIEILSANHDVFFDPAQDVVTFDSWLVDLNNVLTLVLTAFKKKKCNFDEVISSLIELCLLSGPIFLEGYEDGSKTLNLTLDGIMLMREKNTRNAKHISKCCKQIAKQRIKKNIQNVVSDLGYDSNHSDTQYSLRFLSRMLPSSEQELRNLMTNSEIKDYKLTTPQSVADKLIASLFGVTTAAAEKRRLRLISFIQASV